MKIILVDAYNTLFTDDGINLEMLELLDSLPNIKIILTNADDGQMIKFGIDKSPYEVFTLKHNPDKDGYGYYEKMLEHFNLKVDGCIYFEHNLGAIEKAEKVGIKSFHYKNDLKLLEEFIKENV